MASEKEVSLSSIIENNVKYQLIFDCTPSEATEERATQRHEIMERLGKDAIRQALATLGEVTYYNVSYTGIAIPPVGTGLSFQLWLKLKNPSRMAFSQIGDLVSSTLYECCFSSAKGPVVLEKVLSYKKSYWWLWLLLFGLPAGSYAYYKAKKGGK